MKKFILFLVILLLIATDGCRCSGKGSDSGGVGPSITATEIRIVVPENSTHPSDFTFTIDITNAVNAAGILFRLNYDPKKIQIKDINNPAGSVSKGNFFNQDGVPDRMVVNFLGQDPDSGCLIVGLSRVGENPGVSGSGTILTFSFTTVSTGSASVKFNETTTVNSLYAMGVVNISDVKWTNGEITIK